MKQPDSYIPFLELNKRQFNPMTVINCDFFFRNWGFFFSQEKSNITTLLATVAVTDWLLGYDWSVWRMLCQCLGVVCLRRVLAGGVCSSRRQLTGRTAVITGSNVGIGKETAKDFLKRGARVILACRNVTAAEEARQELLGTSPLVEVRRLDLSSLASVRAFAEGLIHDRVDVSILVNNAGVMMCPYTLSTDGHELQMATNHLGHFLLTTLLLPTLQKQPEARIVNVSSTAHLRANPSFLDEMPGFPSPHSYNRMTAYGNSKMANIYFTRQLMKRLSGSNISVFSLHPGVVHSSLARHLVSQRITNLLLKPLCKTPLQGAQTTIYCALEAKMHPCCYFSDCAVGWPNALSQDDELAERLWDVSEAIVKKQLTESQTECKT